MIKAIALPLEITAALRALETSTLAKLGTLAAIVGERTVGYLQSYTEEMRPPVHRGEPWRPAHPGHWGDVTGQLMAAYRFWIEGDSPISVLLVLANGMPYAVYLEQRDGFWVLSGVTDKGGPVEDAIKDGAREVGFAVGVGRVM